VVHFHIRSLRAGVFNHKMKVVIYTLYASSFLILLRNTFRAAAAYYTWDSTANGTEWPFWALEAFPMLVNSYLLNIYPPAKYLPANHKIYLAVDGKTELEGPGMVEKRLFIFTLLDPFDIVGIITKRDNKNKFWEKDGIGGPKEGEATTTAVEESPVKQ
jgi:RTA1 like protein